MISMKPEKYSTNHIAFGKVLQVRNKQTSQILAMKIISKRQLRKKSGYIENVQAERNILKRVNHPFVVNMHCSFQTRDKLFILMDFLAGGELFLRLGLEGIFLENDACFYLSEIILGVDHLHVLGILHRDLKPENILLCNDGHICLTDFGLAKDFGIQWSDQDGNDDQERARTICGTQEYMAPEMVANKGYGKAADYWSLGCIFYEMLSGLPPFSSSKQGAKELFRKIMREKIKMPQGSTAAACKLLKGLLNRNPDARLGVARSTMFEVGGVAGLKQAPFFKKIDWIKLDRKQLEPPYNLNVDHEHDLRNFHNEFTDMPLPRSVKVMSNDDHQPRRVASDTFRGFSFVQEDFLLPDRDAEEVENYWKTAEEDGGSDSDLASSKCGREEEVSQPSPQSVKKKRPPRKKKKKKNLSETASTVSSIPDITPTPSDTEGELNTLTPLVTKATTLSQSDTRTGSNVSQQTNNIQKQSATILCQSNNKEDTEITNSPATKTETPKYALPPMVVAGTWQSVNASGDKSRNRLAGYNAASSGNNYSSTRRKHQSYKNPHQKNPHSTTPRHQDQPFPSTSTQCTSQSPGSWAARLQKPVLSSPAGSSLPAVLTNSESSRLGMKTSITPNSSFASLPPPAPPSPSTDWRQHASPQVQRVIRHSSVRKNQDQMNGLQSGKGNAWPSLKDFPAAPGLGSKQSNSRQATTLIAKAKTASFQQKKPLTGAWEKINKKDQMR
mmetsp:Transcript_32109/g.32491  ORF Transcript_32109/g.32491 Transcript_32109/m.32491 type:complete len:727 (-) Transcript_32109:516-2696(-)